MIFSTTAIISRKRSGQGERIPAVTSPWSSQAPRGGRNPSQRTVALRETVLDQTEELPLQRGGSTVRNSEVLPQRTERRRFVLSWGDFVVHDSAGRAKLPHMVDKAELKQWSAVADHFLSLRGARQPRRADSGAADASHRTKRQKRVQCALHCCQTLSFLSRNAWQHRNADAWTRNARSAMRAGTEHAAMCQSTIVSFWERWFFFVSFFGVVVFLCFFF